MARSHTRGKNAVFEAEFFQVQALLILDAVSSRYAIAYRTNACSGVVKGLFHTDLLSQHCPCFIKISTNSAE
jgi:hypothetical protein